MKNSKKNTPKFIQNIDYALLRKQKSSLLELLSDEKSLTAKHHMSLDGILYLLDNLQDYAVETGIDENIVFEFTDFL